jgi:quinol monooxygenase YgiN
MPVWCSPCDEARSGAHSSVAIGEPRRGGDGIRPGADLNETDGSRKLWQSSPSRVLRIRSWAYYPAFLFATLRVAWQAKKADGNLAVELLRDRRNTFWTLTSWSSEAAMKAFMRAKPHGPAMRKLLEWCDEAALVHWSQSGAELPSWEEAHRRMQREGRPSKVNHPSAAHTAHAIPAPLVRPTRPRNLK